MLVKVENVKFKNDFVEMVVVAGKDAIAKLAHRYWVSVKKVCENLGIDFSGQYKKLKSEADSYEAKFIDVKTNGGVQKVFCIPLSKLNGWLFTINPNRVKPQTKEKLIAYKKEAFDVLYSHFVKEAKKSVKPAQKNLLGDIDSKVIEALIKKSDVVAGYKGQIARLENELAKKQSQLKNYERLLEGDADLYFQALEHFITKIDGMQGELEDMKEILTTKPHKEEYYTRWGKGLFPKSKYPRNRLKRIL